MHRTLSALLLAAVILGPDLHAQDVAIPSARSEPKIVPGDVIRLNIWREPDLSGEILVQEDGLAVLPRLGPIRVVDDTPASLRDRLVAEYEKTLINPSIEVIVLRRILITGEVSGEGVYPVDPTMSLVEVLALAGGPNSSAKKNRVDLIRGDREIKINLGDPVEVRNVSLQSGDQLDVPSANAWIRNWQLIVGVVSSTISLAILLTRDR